MADSNRNGLPAGAPRFPSPNPSRPAAVVEQPNALPQGTRRPSRLVGERPLGRAVLGDGLEGNGPLDNGPPRALPAQARHQVAHFPEMRGDLLGHAASFLPIGELRSVASAGRAGAAARMELRLLRTTSESLEASISAVSSLESFRAILVGGDSAQVAGTIAGMRRDLQFRPLSALLGRISHLPPNERQQATIEFRARVDALDEDQQTPALMTFHRIASHESATGAVLVGENAQLVAAHFGITDPDRIARVERMALAGAAGEAVARGEPVRDIAACYGFETTVGIGALERAAAWGPAGGEVRAGQNVQAVAQRLGFRTEEGIRSLEEAALLGDAGEAAREVANNALRGGQNLREVAEQHGITTRRSYMRMEQMAMHRLLSQPEWNDHDPRTLAANLGIESPVYVDMMTLLSTYPGDNGWGA